MIQFQPISPGQARALGRLGKCKTAPVKLIIGFETTTHNETIFVVPASGKDKRRWDISKGGVITTSER